MGILINGLKPACTYCGCSESDACMLENGAPCAWAQLNPPVCTNPDCVAQSWIEGTAEPLVALNAMRRALFSLQQEGLL